MQLRRLSFPTVEPEDWHQTRRRSDAYALLPRFLGAKLDGTTNSRLPLHQCSLSQEGPRPFKVPILILAALRAMS